MDILLSFSYHPVQFKAQILSTHFLPYPFRLFTFPLQTPSWCFPVNPGCFCPPEWGTTILFTSALNESTAGRTPLVMFMQLWKSSSRSSRIANTWVILSRYPKSLSSSTRVQLILHCKKLQTHVPLFEECKIKYKFLKNRSCASIFLTRQ